MLLRAGTYFIGDPCYCIEDHNKWMALLEACDYYQGGNVFVYNGMTLFGSGTMYGDGEYSDQEGNSYSVDAGLIGATPVQMVDEKYDTKMMNRLGRFVTFEEPVSCYEVDGVIHIGNIVIDTN